jgi:hypothetical protein
VSADRGSVRVLAEHLAQAVGPLDRVLRDPVAFAMTMRRVGWEATTLPASYAAVADAASAAVRAARELGDEPELAEVVAVIDAAGAVYRALDGLDEAPAGIDPDSFLGVIGGELFEYLLAEHLATRVPGAFWAVQAIGVIEFEAKAPTGDRPSFVRTRFDWEVLPETLSDPGAIPAQVLGWGTPDFDFPRVAELVTELVAGIGVTGSIDRVDPALGDAIQAQATGDPGRTVNRGFTVRLFENPADFEPVALSATELPAEGTALPGMLILPTIPSGIDQELDLGQGWTFAVRPGTDLAEQLGIVLRPGEAFVRYPFAPDRPLPSGGFGASLTCASDPPRVVLGEPGGIRLELASTTFSLDVDSVDGELELAFGVRPEGLALVLAPGSLDNFLGSVLGNAESRLEVPFGLTLSNRTGFGVAAGAGFEISLRPELTIAGVRVDRVDLALRLSSGEAAEVALRAQAAISGALGPVSFAADAFGVELPIRFADGNAGPLDVSFGVILPSGLGLGVDVAGVISGGGFLDIDVEAGRYAGIADLDLLGVGIVATGILDTKIPSAPGAWSLFLSLAARFTGIQLGFGFTLNGVGGLVGIDRSLDDDALGEAVRSGSLDQILFPENAIADAELILSEIDAVFPTAAGQYVFGPIVKIGWGTPTLIELDAGVVIQLPEPLSISLLGALSAVLPREEAPILELHVNFAGTWNITEGTLKVDASLSGSQVAGFLITGDMAVRAAFIDDPGFLVSFGGFHPKFVAPDDFPDLDPVGVALDTGDALRVGVGGYFALTSNSVQFGARAELWAGAEGFSIEGGTSFDTLIDFDPFAFSIRLRVWVSVVAADTELLGVLLVGRLSGPNPWRVSGAAEFRLLGLEKRFEVDESFGELANEGPPERADPSQLVRDALDLEDAWSAVGPPGSDPVLVTDAGAGTAVHPSGRVQVTQRLVPLDTTIECYGNAELIGDDLVTLEADGFSPEDVEDVIDWFASAQFFLLDEDEKLTSPSFSQMKAGLVMGGTGADAPELRHEATFDHEIAYRDPNGRPEEPAGAAGPVSASDTAMTRALDARGTGAAAVSYGVSEPLWIVANADTGASTGATPPTGLDFFAARTAMASRNPATSLLVPGYEAELIG